MTAAQNWQILNRNGTSALALTVARRALIWAALGLIIPVAVPSVIAWREQARSQAISTTAGRGADADLCRIVRVLAVIGVLLEAIYIVALAWVTL